MHRHLVFCALLLICNCISLRAQVTPITIRRSEPPSPSATAEELERAGDRLQAEQAHLDAQDYFKAALAKKPNDARVHNKLGVAELQTQQYSEARKHFEKAIRIEPKFASAYNNLGSVYYGQRKYSAAIKQYRKAIQLEPTTASFHANIGAAYFAKKEFDSASASYARALELDPEVLERHARSGIPNQMPHSVDLARYAFAISKVYARAGAIDLALEYLQRAMSEGYKEMYEVLKDADFAALRKDPRFIDLITLQPSAFMEPPRQN